MGSTNSAQCKCGIVCLSFHQSRSHFVSRSVCHSFNLPLCFHSVKLSLCMPVTLFICHCLSLYVCLSVTLSLCLSVTLSVCHSFCRFVCLSLFLSLCLFVCHSVCLPPGFSNTSLSVVLHQLGPDTSSSNLQAIKAIIQRCRFGCSDDYPGHTYIRSNPVSDEEIRQLTEVCMYVWLISQ